MRHTAKIARRNRTPTIAEQITLWSVHSANLLPDHLQPEDQYSFMQALEDVLIEFLPLLKEQRDTAYSNISDVLYRRMPPDRPWPDDDK